MTSPRVFSSLPRRLFVVGDIHGCAAELGVLLEHLRGTTSLGAGDVVVFVGDYIDRGPDSKGVIEALLEFQRAVPEVCFLRGNHEDMLLSYLGYPGTMGHIFLDNGGRETIASYGIRAPRGAAIAVEQVQQVLPARHLAFFLNLENFVVFPGLVVVHAGLNPERALDAQIGTDLFWIRDQFIANVHRFERIVVFGHTPYENVLFHLPYKIGIDTGLVYGNMLTCVELMHGHLFQVKRGASAVETSTFPRLAFGGGAP